MTENYHRRTARVLVTDGNDRLLMLLAAPHPIEPRGCWIAPGSGATPGESISAAAVREVREEVGLTVTEADLGGPVAWSAGRVPAWAETGVVRDDYFYVRVDTHEVDISAMEELEAGNHWGHRRWTTPDLATTTERVIPLRLAPLLTDLVAPTHRTRPTSVAPR